MLSSNFIKISILLTIVGGTCARPQSSLISAEKEAPDAQEKLADSQALGLAATDINPLGPKPKQAGPGPKPASKTEVPPGPGGPLDDHPINSPATETLPSGPKPNGPPGANAAPEVKGPPGAPGPHMEGLKPLGKDARPDAPGAGPTLVPASGPPTGDVAPKAKGAGAPAPSGDKKGPPNEPRPPAGQTQRSSASKPTELSMSALATGLLGVFAGLASILA